ncbi:hypothetical protein GQ457_11G030340 [Hibiscus cannabinus]
MVPQFSEDSPKQPRVLGVGAGLVTGVADGRPPDQGVLITVPTRLEREALPFSEEDQQVVKRSKGEGNEVMDVGDGVVFKFSQRSGLRDAGVGMLSGKEAAELDVEMSDEDVQISSSDGSPEINFSARLHGLVDEKLAKSVIVRLLGRFIGYTALLNRIRALWNPCGEIAMIDLDNGYFFIRFALEEDVSKVLTGGPWLIYGNYLTVQPWSRVLVKVVRIDYNTSEGKRGKFARLVLVVDLNKPLVSTVIIDGVKQKVAYEGLPRICYKCGCYGHAEGACPLSNRSRVDDSPQQDVQGKDDSVGSYGPWMMATNRKAKRVSRIMTHADRGVDSSKSVMVGAGKFDVLANLDDTVVGEEDIVELPVQDVAARSSGSSLVGAAEIIQVECNLVENKSPMIVGARTEGDNRVMLQGSGSSRKVSAVSETAGIGVGEVISAGTIVPVRVSLDPKAHTTICVVEPGKEVSSHSVAGRRTSSGVGLANMRSSPRVPVGKGGEKKGDQGRKKANGRSNSKGPDILALFEPRVRGRKADRFIARNGFDHSFRVEADGFSGGIWVLWKQSVRVDVLAVSNQFVHARCWDNRTSRSFFVTFVYASPNRQKRNGLWHSLDALRPINDMAWVLGGDFNAITSSSEHMGGSCRGDGVNANFNEFFEKFEPLLNAVWKSENSIVQNINEFQSRATQWNRNSFGHIGQRKRKLLARIRGLERVNENLVVPYLSDLEAKLKDYLSETLRQEEMLWFQRARTEWIRDGDRNTKYYHRITKTRHRKKMCTMLKLDNGHWCSDQSLIRQEVVKFFKEVFLSSSVRAWDGNGLFSPLSEVDVANLMAAVKDDEVREAVFSMSPLKSLGFDGKRCSRMFSRTTFDS